MRFAKVGLILAVVALGSTAALAFHEGGVATCTRCHSMHEALNESALLANVDNSSTCLNCHEGNAGSYRVSTPESDAGPGIPPWQRNPGGDFRWLSKSYTWTMPRSGSNNGRQHGHNIVAAGEDGGDVFNYVADTSNVTAPGGTMSSSGLGCASCHDPHGQTRRDENGDFLNPGSATFTDLTYPPIQNSGSYPDPIVPDPGYALGAYRLLGGEGYVAHGTTTYPGAPIAIAPSSYNQTEATNQVRVAYGTPSASGGAGTASWAEWCGTCHGEYHNAPTGTYIHPVDEGLGDAATNYNKYVKTGDLSGTDADSFTSLVPFAENTEDWNVLGTHASNTDAYLNGPTTEDRVTCLTCHRAHASAWDNIMRWNQSTELITLADALGNPEYAAADGAHSGEGQFHRGYSLAEMEAAYYDRDVSVFAGYQRSLCNKCHIKD